jgi:hypothetical protein
MYLTIHFPCTLQTFTSFPILLRTLRRLPKSFLRRFIDLSFRSALLALLRCGFDPGITSFFIPPPGILRLQLLK